MCKAMMLMLEESIFLMVVNIHLENFVNFCSISKIQICGTCKN